MTVPAVEFHPTGDQCFTDPQPTIAVTVCGTAKPWYVAGEDDSYPGLCTVRVLPNGAALATNGFIGVYIEHYLALNEGQEGVTLPDMTLDANSLKVAYKATKTRTQFGRIPALIEPEGGHLVLKLGYDQEQMVRQVTANQPPLLKVLAKNTPAPPMPDRVGLNVQYLTKIARALGSEGNADKPWGLEIGLPKPKRGEDWPNSWSIVRPTCADSAAGFGIIMPIKMNGLDDHVWDAWRKVVVELNKQK